MPKKFTQEEVATYFKEHGYTLLSEYTRYDNKLTLVNKQGVKGWVSLGNFKGGQKPENGFPPKEQMDDWVSEYVGNLGFTLKSKYVNARTPLHLVHNDTGRTLYRRFDSIRRGMVSVENAKKSVEEIRGKGLELGFLLLSEEYKNSSTRLLWQDTTTGDKFLRSWKHLNSGHTKPIMRGSYQLEKEFISNYGGLGYYLDMTEEEYDNNEYPSGKTNSKTIVVNHTKLNQPWVTTRQRFRDGALSRINNTHRSSGELLVMSVLNAYPSIDYSEQHLVYISDSKHMFDFYIPSHNLYIEYDGAQHYNPATGYLKDKLNEIQSRDLAKEEYVRSVKGTLIRIPYTAKVPNDVLPYLLPILGEPEYRVNVLVEGSVKEVAEYYASHSLPDTIRKYSLSNSTIVTYFKRVYGITKQEYMRNKEDRKVDPRQVTEYVLTHTYQETKIRYNIPIQRIRNYFMKEHGMVKEEYLRYLRQHK